MKRHSQPAVQSLEVPPSRPVRAEADGPRRIHLQGPFNFRDVGGYPTADGRTVRRRRLYRSDSLHRLTESDVRLLATLGLRTVLDLRSEEEVDRQGIGLLATSGAQRFHLPLLPSKDSAQARSTSVDLGALYWRLLERVAPSVRAVIEVLASPESYAAVVHCVAGKDRTGIVIALVLRSLGVPDSYIIDDYCPSGDYIAPLTDILLADPAYKNTQALLLGGLMASPAAAMESFLHSFDERYSSVFGYLASIAVEADAVQRMQRWLLE